MSSEMLHTNRKIAAIDRFVRLAAGPHVLKKAQSIERMTTRMNCPHGKNGSTKAPRKRLNYSSIV